MQFNMRILSVLMLLLIMTSSALACNVDISGLVTQLKADGSYDTSITAPKSSDIDIKLTFDMSYSGNDCPTNLTAKVVITKYSESASDWVDVKTQNESFELDNETDYSVYFTDEFNTGSNSNYTEFRVESSILNGTTVKDSDEATLSVENNSCDGIKINTSSITIDEGSNVTKTFTIENNTSKDFRITNADFSSSSAIIESGSIDYPEYVYSHSDDSLDLLIEPGYVSSRTSTTLVLSVEGYLGNTFCSASAIGKKNISVTINNTSSNDDGSSYSTSSDCDNIDIQTRNTELDESSTQKLAFGIKNNSTKRFEVLAVETASSSFTLNNYFNEKYIFPGQTGDLILNAVLPNVTQTRTLQGTVKVRGIFSDGRSCSFTQIGTKTFDVNVLDLANNSINPNCAGFNISVPDSITVENYGDLAFTITNASNRTAKIIIEGTMDISPTVIVLPKNSSLSKKVSVGLNSQTGVIKFIPTIEGCSLSAKTVQVKNTANGTLNEATMSANTDRDYNSSTITLTIQVDNPTNKIFDGTLNIDSPEGWPDISRSISVVPGENTFTEKLGTSGNYSEGNIKVSFTSDGKIISANTNTSNQNNSALAGLFAFGTNAGAIGIILLIILVIVVLVGILDYSPKSKATTSQGWVNNKD